MTGCRRYGADTPARQAHVAASVTTRSAKSPKRSQNRSSMVAAVEARESALKLQASRLQRHMDPETPAKLVKAEGSDYQKRYNAAARRWISTIVALPVFIVLSYHLYNRPTGPSDISEWSLPKNPAATLTGNTGKIDRKRSVA
ncbi:hypothetical protein E4U57_001951 [Claviceps arundinis]|uniref:Transmembrane protein n=1 Tax=Claviceps arundinis TaxID=1623583 RepID=A0ABQ7PBG1_9HYPO|nr:hypothetical protein E4U57_001951 [Claviceps arundinis]